MPDRPIIFSAPMVRALLDGRKTQTRRILKPQPVFFDVPIDQGRGVGRPGRPDELWPFRCMGRPDERDWQLWAKRAVGPCVAGDRLWVREAYALLPRTAYRASVGTGTIEQQEHPTDGYTAAVFREGFDRSGRPLWRPSIHIPRWASRLTLVVTEVRVERLNSMSPADAIAEGIQDLRTPEHSDFGIPGLVNAQHPVRAFWLLWEHINGEGSWLANPWVAAISFTVHRANIDALDIGAAT